MKTQCTFAFFRKHDKKFQPRLLFYSFSNNESDGKEK